jgi:polysaccharide chain length determinant protein (PEP-CTERM system associated)
VNTDFDLSRILSSFSRQKGLIFSVFIVVSTLAAYLASILPEVYRSSTLILVSPQKVPTSFVFSTVTTDLNERMQSIMQEILSRTRLEKIVQEFGLYPDGSKVSTMEDRVETLRRKINIDFRRNNVFQLSFESESPEKAKEVTARVSSLFIEQNLQVREQQAIGTKSFINAEAERLRKELEQQEADVNRFKAANRFELPDVLDANLRTLEQLRTELQATLSRLASLQERRASLEKQIVESEISGPELAGAKANGSAPTNLVLQTRQRELAEVLRHYSEKHPDVIRLKAEIAAAEEEAASEKTPTAFDRSLAGGSVTSPLRQLLQRQVASLESEIKSSQGQSEALRRQVAVYQTRIDNTSVRGIELSKISRTYEITLRKYQDLLAKGLESELSENMEKKQKGEQFQILDPANFPLKPIRPNRQMILLIGVLAGLGGGFGLAFIWDNLNTSFRRSEDLAAYVSLPLLATIPALLTRSSVLEQRRSQGVLVLASLGLLVVGLICVRMFGPMYF